MKSWPLEEFCPPHEFVKNWESRYIEVGHKPEAVLQRVANQAAQWGADQELEACCALMDDWGLDETDLRVARRPKPPSLKEQALDALKVLPTPAGQVTLDITDLNTIRRALEQLSDTQ